MRGRNYIIEIASHRMNKIVFKMFSSFNLFQNTRNITHSCILQEQNPNQTNIRFVKEAEREANITLLFQVVCREQS